MSINCDCYKGFILECISCLVSLGAFLVAYALSFRALPVTRNSLLPDKRFNSIRL